MFDNNFSKCGPIFKVFHQLIRKIIFAFFEFYKIAGNLSCIHRELSYESVSEKN